MVRTAVWLPLMVASFSVDAAAASHVVLLDAYGTPAHFEVHGRVLEEKQSDTPRKDAHALHNLKENLELLDAEGVENARVTVVVEGVTRQVATGHEGDFMALFDGVTPAPGPGVSRVEVTVTEPEGMRAQAEGPLYLWPEAPFTLLVSDVDDTVVQTHVRNRKKLVGTALFKNAAQLEVVPGAPEAYRNAVTAGAAGIIYLSGSPQGFHDRIRDYLKLQGFPEGPILLKDFSRESPTQQENYKRPRLEMLAARFPGARFILVGDSGEKDPEIYRAFSAAHPGRVAGIVIRQTPDAPASRERLVDCHVLQDHQSQPGLLSGMVKAAPAAGGASSSSGK